MNIDFVEHNLTHIADVRLLNKLWERELSYYSIQMMIIIFHLKFMFIIQLERKYSLKMEKTS